MKNRKKLITGLTIMGITLLSSNLSILAATPAKSISVQGSNATMIVGTTKELDSKIQPAKANVKDQNILWSSSNPKVIKVLETNDDDTKVKALQAGTATITVKIKGTTLQATKKITVKKASTTTATTDYEKSIASYKSDLTAINKEITSTTPANTYKNRKKQYLALEKKMDKVDRQLDTLEDTIEDQYEYGTLTAKQYRSLERLMENVENYMDEVDDALDMQFDYEFDD